MERGEGTHEGVGRGEDPQEGVGRGEDTHEGMGKGKGHRSRQKIEKVKKKIKINYRACEYDSKENTKCGYFVYEGK